MYHYYILDKLTNNLIDQAVEWDMKDNLNKPLSKRSDKHMIHLVDSIRSCGVCFQVWEKKNGDGRKSGQYDCTSLMGSAKKTLKKLPDKLKGVIIPETEEAIIKLWKVSNAVISILINKDLRHLDREHDESLCYVSNS